MFQKLIDNNILTFYGKHMDSTLWGVQNPYVVEYNNQSVELIDCLESNKFALYDQHGEHCLGVVSDLREVNIFRKERVNVDEWP